MNLFIFISLLSAVFASLASSNENISLAPDDNFDVNIRNELLDRFDKNLLVRLTPEQSGFFDHLCFLADNKMKLALKDEKDLETILNMLEAVNQSWQLQRNTFEGSAQNLQTQVNKIKRRILRIRKRSLKGLEDQLRIKTENIQRLDAKMRKIQKFIDYCTKDTCHVVMQPGTKLTEEEYSGSK